MLKVSRRKDGTVAVSLNLYEALVLKSLPERIRRLLTDPDFSDRTVLRLFPRAYRDPAKDREYRRLLGEDLLRRKLAGVEAFEKSLRRMRVKQLRAEITVRAEDYDLWLGFVNDMRLVLGTELEIEEDDWSDDAFDASHPRAEDLALLHYLSWLEEELLQASGFPLPRITPPESPRDSGSGKGEGPADKST